MKKRTVFLFLFLFSSFFIVLVSAQPPFQAATGTVGIDIRAPPVEFIKQGQAVIANTHAFNKSDGLPLTNETTQCFLHLFNPVGAHLIQQEMVWEEVGDLQDFDWQVTILGGNFSSVGDYGFIIQCNATLIGGFISSAIQVTPTGLEANFNFYIIILLISAVLIIWGFTIKDPWVVIFGTFGLYFTGLYIMLNGIVGIKDMVTTWAIALILLGVAGYISFKAAIEVVNG